MIDESTITCVNCGKETYLATYEKNGFYCSSCFNKDSIQNEIDGIYEIINLMIKNERWELLNTLFVSWEGMAWRTDVEILKSCAISSFLAKDKIPYRTAFIKTCRRLHPGVELWKGLE